MCLAVPGKLIVITDFEPLSRSGNVSFGGIVKEVNLAFVPDAEAGDYLLVHAGVAIAVIDAGEASKVLTYINEMESSDCEDFSDEIHR
jgi:hydrogenase expression/formation protein HypC